jgi:hypothetical protein
MLAENQKLEMATALFLFGTQAQAFSFTKTLIRQHEKTYIPSSTPLSLTTPSILTKSKDPMTPQATSKPRSREPQKSSLLWKDNSF